MDSFAGRNNTDRMNETRTTTTSTTTAAAARIEERNWNCEFLSAVQSQVHNTHRIRAGM